MIYKFFTVIFTIILAFTIAQRLSLIPANALSNSSVPDNADVVIVGAGTGGVSAAIQAARLGTKVVLIEETDYIGGQMTAAGVSTMDGNFYFDRYGLLKEFADRVISHYNNLGKSVQTCYWSNHKNSLCFEPHIGRKILEEMLAAETNITLLLTTTIAAVNQDNNGIKSVTLNTGQTIQTKLVIDATEYGDIIRITEPNYRLGNGTKQSPSPNACIQDITYTAIIKKYPQGVPPELKINTPPPGYSDEIKTIFSQTVTKNGHSTWTGAYPVNWPVHNAYRGIPDSSNPNNYTATAADQYPLITKTGINWANDYTVDAARYFNDPAYRKEANCQAKLRTIQFLYYMQTELNQPDWSVANDEGYNTAYNIQANSCPNIPTELKTIESHLPVIPYVRESIRGIGPITLSGPDIKRVGSPRLAAKNFPTSIAIGDYGTDLHRCSADQNLETHLESSSDHTPGGPFQIPLEALISKTTPGLIFAEKNLSQSRLVNGATRLQPITMLTGQAAGALAAIARQNNLRPSNVKPILVQQTLLQYQSPLFPFSDLLPGSPGFVEGQLSAAMGIMNGTTRTTFNPDSPLTRAQAAIILLKAKYNSSYSPPEPTFQRFNDTPSSHYAYKWIDAFAEKGITSGCGNNNFCPENPLTRAQAAVFFLRTKHGNTYTPPPATGQVFNDVPASHPQAAWIEAIKNQGITNGCGNNNFCPENPLTRAQAAVFLIKTFEFTKINTLSLPGDLNGDGRVNIFDFNLLVSGFGNPYTIFDYNNLVGNFGK